jgi:hypothetical protein
MPMPPLNHQIDNKKTMLLQKAKKIPTSTHSDLKVVDTSNEPIPTPTADLHKEQQDESLNGIVLCYIYIYIYILLYFFSVYLIKHIYNEFL